MEFHKKLPLSKTRIAIISTIVFLISFLYLSNKYTLDDYANFVGDTWEYQSQAVNLSLGHGYRSGGIEKFSTYMFKNYHFKPHVFKLFKKFQYTFYRTPSYLFFVACIYKIFGIHPAIVKIIQTMLLSASSVIGIIIACYYWGKKGVLPGILTATIFTLFFAPDPSIIMTESFFTFMISIWCLFFILFETKFSKFHTFILGIVTALTIFVKAHIFIPFFFIVYLIIKFKRSPKELLLLSISFILGLAMIIAPWSIFASSRSNKLIILSTQGDNVILDSNNEDSIYISGDWQPAWRKWNKGHSRYLYNRLDADCSTIKKLSIFFYKNKKHIPRLIFNKLDAGFNTPQSLIIISLFLLYYGFVFLKGESFCPTEKYPIFPLILFANIFLFTIITYGNPRIAYVFMHIFALPASYYFVHLITNIKKTFSKN